MLPPFFHTFQLSQIPISPAKLFSNLRFYKRSHLLKIFFALIHKISQLFYSVLEKLQSRASLQISSRFFHYKYITSARRSQYSFPSECFCFCPYHTIYGNIAYCLCLLLFCRYIYIERAAILRFPLNGHIKRAGKPALSFVLPISLLCRMKWIPAILPEKQYSLQLNLSL